MMEEPKYIPYNSNNTNRVPEDLPNSTAILVLGILSIIFVGLIGIILAIIALSMSRNARHAYEDYPGDYTEASYSRVNAGRICAIIGLSLVAILILIVLVILSYAG